MFITTAKMREDSQRQTTQGMKTLMHMAKPTKVVSTDHYIWFWVENLVRSE